MKKISKQKSIDLILSEMKKGNLDAVQVLGEIGKNWEVSQSSFYRHWKEATTIFEERQSMIQSELLKEDVRFAKESLKKDILTLQERKEIATRIARGETLTKNDEPPKVSDRLKALEYLSKVEGDFAPKKLHVSQPLPILTMRIDKEDVEQLRLNG